MLTTQQAYQFMQSLYRDAFHRYDVDAFARYYHRKALWHTQALTFDYDAQMEFFLSNQKEGHYLITDILNVVPTQTGLTTWVLHKHFTPDHKQSLAVNTMINLDIKDDKIIAVNFMWDLPPTIVMPNLKSQLNNLHTPALEIEDILSTIEMKSFMYILRGYSARMIAEKLHRSVRTIETHFENIKLKLGLTKIQESTDYALEKGFLAFAPIIKTKRKIDK